LDTSRKSQMSAAGGWSFDALLVGPSAS
jgi:hypothetical protein